MVFVSSRGHSFHVSISEDCKNHCAVSVRPMCHQLFQATLPFQHPLPSSCGICISHFLPDFLQIQLPDTNLLVPLPIRVLALSPAVKFLLADRAALQLNAALAAVGADLHALRHRWGRARTQDPLPPAASPPTFQIRSVVFKIDCKRGTFWAAAARWISVRFGLYQYSKVA